MMRPAGINRREFLKLAGGTVAGAVLPRSLPGRLPAALTWSVTGRAGAGLSSFDTTMESFIKSRNISGGQLAVTYNGRLVLARGYTFSADPEDITIQPTSLFRIASISKPLTAVAVLRLVQDGQLGLHDRLVDLLPLAPPPGQSADARLADVTVLDLLQHLGGWDRTLSYDPMFYDRTIAGALGLSLPIAQENIVTYMTGQPLQHAPGTAYAYSNYGYALLTRIVAAVTGQAYETYVQQAILEPLDVLRLRLGRTLPADRLPFEAKYHTQYDGYNVFQDSLAWVPRPDGGWNLENMDGHGGWLATAVELAQFAATFDAPAASPILNAASVETMFGLPQHIDPLNYSPGAWYYGCGWAVRDWGNGVRNTWHAGSLDGTYTLLVRRWDGVSWCVLFNQRDDPSGLSYSAIDGELHAAANAVSSWPADDFFDDYLCRPLDDAALAAGGSGLALTWSHRPAYARYQILRASHPHFAPDDDGVALAGEVTPSISGGGLLSFIDSGRADDAADYFYRVYGVDENAEPIRSSPELGKMVYTLAPGP